MGGLGRRRTKARIVKKTRNPKSHQKFNLAALAEPLKQQWDKSQSVKQNFERLGIVMNIRPSMRQTKEGEALLEHAKKRLNKQFFASKAQVK